MVPLPKRKVPPPPRQPGTHTNAEVKEALHARALRRTIIITAVMFLLFACLAVVSNTAQQYEAADTTPSSPKMLLVVVPELTPRLLRRAQARGRCPFARLLGNAGGVAGVLHSNYSVAHHPLVTLLTGRTNSSSSSLDGTTSLLRAVKAAGFRVVVAAPQAYWSNDATPSRAVTDNDDAAASHCSRVGLYDTECSGSRCPSASSHDVNGSCNVNLKYVTCDGAVQLQQDELVRSVARALRDQADLTYVHIDTLRDANTRSNNNNTNTDTDATRVGDELAALSEVNLLDAALGSVALALAERTRTRRESWLLLLTGDGANAEQQAPVFAASFAHGQLVQLQPLSSPSDGNNSNSNNSNTTTPPLLRYTTDVYTTVLRWFDVLPADADATRALGICSSGQHISNCRGNTTRPTSS